MGAKKYQNLYAGAKKSPQTNEHDKEAERLQKIENRKAKIEINHLKDAIGQKLKKPENVKKLAFLISELLKK